ncbi:hypothetical protein [Lysobacter soli]|nr:hypothetical protein [Lysobacter soli]
MRSAARNVSDYRPERIRGGRLVVTQAEHLKDLCLVRIELAKRHLGDRT